MPETPAPSQPLAAGDPVPWFIARGASNPRYHFSTVAGRYVVLCFFRSAGSQLGAQVLAEVAAHAARFDDDNLAFFGVSEDPEDERRKRVSERYPGYRFFWDFSGKLRRAFGVADTSPGHTFLLDPSLQIIAALPLSPAKEHVSQLMQAIDGQPPVASLAAAAPVLVVPRVFEPEFCAHLIRYYREHPDEDSGFMQEREGQTVGRVDYGLKRRRDCLIEDEALRQACAQRVSRRLNPLIARAFQFRATRMERYVVACYDAGDGGYFRPHRDNTMKGTAHRRFAVSLFLNTGEYEGGDLRFPEYGSRPYSAPAGGAVVFSCSLLHEATPVTRGQRFMFLPFLYDEAAARLREKNARFLEEDKQGYKADR